MKNIYKQMRFSEMHCKFFIFLLMLTSSIFSQTTISGVVTSIDGKKLQKVEVLDISGNVISKTNTAGFYEFKTTKKQFTVVFYLDEYELQEVIIKTTEKTNYNIELSSFSEELSEVEIIARKRKAFELKRLKDVEGTAIYAGKKTEVVLLEESTAALASNNARQIYSQIAGLNIYQNDNAGLQLNIGGRGLDPNRTSNFNTRQNGYDISADVLGYPESYYTPPAEALEQIQIVRGAASLQYGTQFGGMVNFILKKPNPNKPFEIVTRNTLGSNNLFTNFTSIGGTSKKFSYYGYYNYKQGDGFRPNSEFNSKNAFLHLGYELSDKTKIEAELTYLNYLAHQPGGLTDSMFEEDAFQSNRTRNWFQVDWFLYYLRLEHDFSEKTKFTVNFFGLDASRKAVGFRGNPYASGLNSNPITIEDTENSDGTYFYNRDVIVGEFNNWGLEARFLTKYNLFNQEAAFLIGTKYYNANNASEQGPGSRNADADFSILNDAYPEYPNVSSFTYPNKNVAIFGENIFRFSDKFSITPGFRFENIRTESEGSYFFRNYDAANNLLFSQELEDNRVLDRSFVLLGLGLSYKPNKAVEFYGNASQNYRSVTFSDIRTTSPTFIIDENITDEKGLTLDAGARGRFKDIVSYDIGVFNIFYNDKIGNVLDNRANWVRTNVGDAVIYGFESYVEFNVLEALKNEFPEHFLKFGINFSYIDSEYSESLENNIEGKEVEFIPDVNLKTILKFGYKDFTTSLQYSYLSEQFTDSSNATSLQNGDIREGVIGEIPAYGVLDFAASYSYKFLKIEAGINNLLDETYFTQRATGYPGPGIITSAPRNWYTTVQFKF